MPCPRIPTVANILRRTALAIAIAGMSGSGSYVLAADVYWTGNAGAGLEFWDLPANWSSTPSLPGLADNALIDAAFLAIHRSGANTVSSLQAGGAFNLTGGTLGVSSASFINGLFNASGGTLAGTGTLTAGSLQWTGGTMQDAGSTIVSGTATIGDGSTQSSVVMTAGRVLSLQAATTFQNSALSIGNGATLNNAGTFTSLGDVRGSNAFDNEIQTAGSPSTFVNSGSFVQNSGSVTTTIRPAFDNAGSVTVQSGVLVLSGGGSSSGVFTASTGAILAFGGGDHALANATVAGPGTVRVNGGTTTLNDTSSYTATGALEIGGNGAFIVNANVGAPGPSVLRMTSGTLGGTGTLTAGSLQWTGGTMQDAGTTTITGTATIGDGSTQTNVSMTTGRVLNLQDATTFQNSALGIESGATLNNAGTFTSLGDVRGTDRFDNAIQSTGAAGTFVNTGSYIQNSGSATTTIRPAFNNSGNVTVQSGALVLSGGGSSSGTFSVSSGAVLAFGGGEHSLANATIAGAGTVRVSGGTTTMNNTSSYTATGTLEIDGSGAFVVNNNVGAPGPSLLRMTNGSLGGSGTLTAGSLQWTGGPMQDAGTTTIRGTATIGDGSTPTSAFLTTGRVLNLQGATTFQSSALHIDNGATLNNAGTFTSRGNVQGTDVSPNEIVTAGSPGSFVNTGTYVQDSGSAMTRIGVSFQNTGEIRIDSGMLLFTNGLSLLGDTSVLDLPITALLNGNLDIDSAALLDGTLRLDFAFTPALGQVITVFSYDARTGEFDAIQGAGSGTGFLYSPIYDTESFQVRVAPIPEPETYAMMLIGLCLVVVAVKRRAGDRKNASA
jgi:hypothetical protein